MDLQKAEQDIKAFLLKAGDYARDVQKTVKTNFKAGEQAVTEADLAISKMAQEDLAHWLEQENHLLIDEESIDKSPEEAFDQADYLWVLDPIDGTAGYAMGRLMWGVMLALVYRGKPVTGGIYLPVINRLLITENGTSWSINTQTGEKEELKAKAMALNSQTFVESYANEGIKTAAFGFNGKLWANTPEAAAQCFYSTLLNQSCGAVLVKGFSLWDIAAPMALAQNTGHQVFAFQEKEEWPLFRARDFRENWKLTQNYLMTHPDHYDFIAETLRA